MPDMKHVHVVVSGRVQGVFFRARTRDEAIRNNVRGWVRNLPDGRVEAVFEGNPDDVGRLVDWCRVGPGQAVVEHVEAVEEPFTGAFQAFEIRYGA